MHAKEVLKPWSVSATDCSPYSRKL